MTINGTMLICLGSLNAKNEDRHMKREEVSPFQYYTLCDKKVFEFSQVSSMGKLGLGSLAVSGNTIYFTTGWEIYEVTADTLEINEIVIPGLNDVHDLEIIDDKLYFANTGINELVCYDPNIKKILERITLPKKTPMIRNSKKADVYHCNQCFEDDNGDLLALVHHVDGKQNLVSISSRIMVKLKQQGNGGVVDARTGEVKLSGLSAPHSLRSLNDGSYIVCDSGRFELCHYDENWKLIKKVSTGGFSRGIAMERDYVYVGVSATRKRYVGILPDSGAEFNTILIFEKRNFELVEKIIVKNVEQINNLYIATKELNKWIQNG